MFTARKVRANNTIVFAAEGFRLGLFEDFGIPFEGKDPVLDDMAMPSVSKV